jgi:hypothetical protein
MKDMTLNESINILSDIGFSVLVFDDEGEDETWYGDDQEDEQDIMNSDWGIE